MHAEHRLKKTRIYVIIICIKNTQISNTVFVKNIKPNANIMCYISRSIKTAYIQ